MKFWIYMVSFNCDNNCPIIYFKSQITWLRNQKPLKESDRIEITTVTEDLDITKVIVTIKTTKIEDAGTYEIIAENREGKSVTSLILNVTGKKL